MTADPTKTIAHTRLPRWKKWVLDALFNFDRRTLDDWASMMSSHVQSPGGPTPMATARYTVQLMAYAETLRLATQILASHGHPAARSQLADAALDFRSAEHLLSPARDVLLRAAGADRVTDHD
ncbi:hypothetical protein IUT00_24700 [Mycobacteroides abscessus subsp. massiliense]|uniref:hypothetical protein n=1 Tax=Mycobacteroides abscessus TaxID=36809 RepID=UPI0019D1B62D|nr:hypothetical protein [Mycobacteroides abscessus]MBN7384438.1 hypothetical protein [Mycobacteroides abscessus subsp. massiliense]